MSGPVFTFMSSRRRLARWLFLWVAAALALVAVPPAYADPTGAATRVPGTSGSEFDPPSVGWYSYRDQTSAQFADTFARLKADYVR